VSYYQKHKSALQARGRDYMRARRTAHPDKCRDAKLRSSFGISVQDYERMYRAQGGVCAVCFEKETSKRKGVVRRLCVDHNHATGQVRGLLCSWCNLAIGYLRDDALRAHSVMVYLETYK
jgi:hypothetical protein